MRVRWLGALVGCALAVGCGYSLVRYGGRLGEFESLAIRTPRNESYEPGVEFVVADALRREVLRRQGVRLVADPSRADVIIGGSVRPIRTRAASVDSVLLALEYELTLELALKATLADGRALDLDPTALRESERYLASADAEATRKNREEALRRVAEVLAGRVYDSLSESLTP